MTASPNAEVQRLLVAYHKLDARFRADLADPRDLALCRSAVLMLLKFINETSES